MGWSEWIFCRHCGEQVWSMAHDCCPSCGRSTHGHMSSHDATFQRIVCTGIWDGVWYQPWTWRRRKVLFQSYDGWKVSEAMKSRNNMVESPDAAPGAHE